MPAVFFKLFLLFVTVPLVELVILLVMGSRYGIGLFPTLAIVIGTGLAGAWLAHWQGAQTLARIRYDLRRGHMPTDAATDAVLIFFAGALLMTPGILTDILGFTLLVPAGRRMVKHYLFRWFQAHFKIETLRPGEPYRAGDRVIDSHVVDGEDEKMTG